MLILPYKMKSEVLWMELSKVTETRRSVREYINKPVETEKLREMIAAAHGKTRRYHATMW